MKVLRELAEDLEQMAAEVRASIINVSLPQDSLTISEAMTKLAQVCGDASVCINLIIWRHPHTDSASLETSWRCSVVPGANSSECTQVEMPTLAGSVNKIVEMMRPRPEVPLSVTEAVVAEATDKVF